MKYWRGYLVAAIFAAITGALVAFAKAHSVLVDMIYPYITRMIISSMADWTGGMNFCLWQVLVIGMVALGIVSVIFMLILRWNPIQWGGWVLAVIMFFSMMDTVIYGLNDYSSPLADDVQLTVTEYTISQLDEATIYFRDKAKELSDTFARDKKGAPEFGTFEELAEQAGNGFTVLTYDEAISVFAGSTAPVKKLSWNALATMKGDSGITFPLTGEAAVNPNVPAAILPFAMSKEMAHRMSISREEDARFAAFLAGIYNESPAFQYSAYLMAYQYCYDALNSISTSTAKACALEANAGLSQNMRTDLKAYKAFFGDRTVSVNLKTGTTESKPTNTEHSIVTFSEYSDVSELLVSWYIQNFIDPNYQGDETPFNPLDPNQVDLTDSSTARNVS